MAKSIAPTTSDAAVQKATGKAWQQWLALLDKAGAKKMTHKEIVAWLHAKHEMSAWWEQMVTVTYEKARGLREKHQTTSGYQVSVGRTLNVPLATLWKAWADPRRRARWFPEKLTVAKATPNRSFRASLSDGTKIDNYFWEKPGGKSAFSLSHTKLSDAKAVATAKKAWAARLTALKALLNP